MIPPSIRSRSAPARPERLPTTGGAGRRSAPWRNERPRGHPDRQRVAMAGSSGSHRLHLPDQRLAVGGEVVAVGERIDNVLLLLVVLAQDAQQLGAKGREPIGWQRQAG